MLKQVAVTKAPQHADARQTGRACRGDVDLRIADKDRLVRVGTELFHGGQQHVRRRLAPDGRRLADGDRHGVREKLCPQCAHGLVRLVGHDGKLAPLRVQLLQQRVNAGVGGSLDAAVGGIVGVILCQQRLKECAVRSGGNLAICSPGIKVSWK